MIKEKSMIKYVNESARLNWDVHRKVASGGSRCLWDPLWPFSSLDFLDGSNFELKKKINPQGNEILSDPQGPCSCCHTAHCHSLLSGIGNQAPGILLPSFSILRSGGQGTKCRKEGNIICQGSAIGQTLTGHILYWNISFNLLDLYPYHYLVLTEEHRTQRC